MTGRSQTNVLVAPAPVAAARQDAGGRRSYVYGPLIDFLCLGGGSVIVCAAIALLLPKGIPEVQQAALATLLVTAINRPPFRLFLPALLLEF